MFTRTFLTAIGTRSLQILGTLRRQVLLKQETPASQESFDTLRSANDQLDEVRWSKNGEIFQWLKDHWGHLNRILRFCVSWFLVMAVMAVMAVMVKMPMVPWPMPFRWGVERVGEPQIAVAAVCSAQLPTPRGPGDHRFVATGARNRWSCSDTWSSACAGLPAIGGQLCHLELAHFQTFWPSWS